MKQALGLVEISGLSTAVVVADTMVKAANVRILEIENTKGLGYMTVKVVGDVGAVNAAVNAGKQIGTANGKLVSWKVIPRPSDYVDQTFCCPDPPGADELVFLDITASSDNRGTVVDMVRRVAETVFIPFTVGGGIRTVEDFRMLLREGADKISINSSAIDRPRLISDAADKFGRQCVVVAIDARG